MGFSGLAMKPQENDDKALYCVATTATWNSNVRYSALRRGLEWSYPSRDVCVSSYAGREFRSVGDNGKVKCLLNSLGVCASAPALYNGIPA